MADIKLFSINDGVAGELRTQSPAIERSLQTLIERNLEVLLGLRFLSTEYSTGRVHNGRIDTLGIDEDDSPVILEYKRRVDENVINQGLFYLDWLMDHQAEFQLLVEKVFGHEAATRIDWSEPRLICVAGDFTRYDEHAVQQIDRSIDLVRYRKYDGDLLLLELANGSWRPKEATIPEVTSSGGVEEEIRRVPSTQRGFLELFERSSKELQWLWVGIEEFLLNLGDDVQVKQLKHYKAFRRLRNFASGEIHPNVNDIVIFVKLDIASIVLEEGFTRDVREIGHYGTGNVEIRIRNETDFERAKPLMRMAYGAE